MTSKKIIPFISILCIAISCKQTQNNQEGFHSVAATHSNLSFNNKITTSKTFNYNTYPYIYMGGGVALGDIDNDGLTDVYLTGNMVSNELYRNKGDLILENISESAQVEGDSRWYTGATMVDINTDGWLDIYACVSGLDGNTKNQLFINNGDLTFTESAEEYGIADASNSIQATFFDYDNDGDVDLFVANYPIVPLTQPNLFYQQKMLDEVLDESGHLYRNDGGTFTNVTQEAGVLNFGLTLGVIATDFNNDGNKDLYLSNDFNVPDYFYLNNGNGTFREVVKSATNQTSFFGMGVDAADFNNDGLMDLVQVDMMPEDHFRSKTNMATMDPQSFDIGVESGFHYQYMQNSLQLNNGINEDGVPKFSNIARFGKVATTDWSWGTLFADFDNDGLKDIFITNGMRLDVNNNDFLNPTNITTLTRPIIDMEEAPETPIDNYVFKNMGNYGFKNVSESWNANTNGFSNGVAYGDLDNDGDLDLVINNIDQAATLLENKLPKSNYLRIKLKGSTTNPMGLGTKVKVTTQGKSQWLEHTLTKGFQSSVEPILHFGLGDFEKIEEIMVEWPDGNMQYIKDIMPNKVIEVNYTAATVNKKQITDTEKAFKDITITSGISFAHQEDLYDDFLLEPLLPHRNSRLGPGLAVADVNNDGLDDFYIGNAVNRIAQLFIQTPEGTFKAIDGPWSTDKQYEDTGAVFIDIDNDGDQDLYVVSGGNTAGVSNERYQDRLYININGEFVKYQKPLISIATSGYKVAPFDYDNDGDLDFFLGGRIEPGKYLQAPKSYLLRNEGGKDMEVVFKDVTTEVIPEVANIGMITDAMWYDYNNDNQIDLVLAGEWMPITLFKNENGHFKNMTKKLGFADTTGWWYSLASADVDNDGDMDIVAGNLGLNSKHTTSKEAPFEVFINDFDENGEQDIVLSKTKKGKRLPVRGRQCSSEQIPMIKTNFETYELFASAELEDIYGKTMLENSLHYSIDTFSHLWFENTDDGTFKRHQLPTETQFSSINNISFFNYNQDEYIDILISGNLFNTEVETSRVDASYGMVLKNVDGKSFEALPNDKTGLFVNGEVRQVTPIKIGADKKSAYLFAINNDSLRLIKQDVKLQER